MSTDGEVWATPEGVTTTARGRPLLLLRRVDGLAGPVLAISTLITTANVLEALISFSASGDGPASAAALSHDLVGMLGVFLLVAQLAVTGTWLLRVQQNAKAVWPEGVDHGVAWAYFGWVVPIVCLFMPKQIVDKSWRITADATDDASPAGSTSWWWTGWLVLNIVGSVEGRLGGIHPQLEVVVAVMTCATLLAWIRVVRGVTATQDRLVAAHPGS
jgi:hypothetical protein